MSRLTRYLAVCPFLICCLHCDTSRPMPRAESSPADTSARLTETYDRSILFVGNSHTYMHDIPNLVRRMIEFRHPGEKILVDFISVGHLDDLQDNKKADKLLAARKWDVVVLQAQKISQSGRFDYSKQVGIDFAKRARAKGGRVLFYCEWGLRGVAGDAAKIEKVYDEMAKAADGELAPVGRAWDAALAERPELKLHAEDGNHQSELGAFLTACALYSCITHESPLALAKFPYEPASEGERAFLAGAAERGLRQTAKSPATQPRQTTGG